MAIIATDRGNDGAGASSANLVSNVFTPSPGSLLVALMWVNNTNPINFSGHDGGAAWTNIFPPTQVYAGVRFMRIDAAISGSSPTSGVITVSSGYFWRREVQFIEFAGADTSGSVADAFGNSQTDGAYNEQNVSLDLSPLAGPESFSMVASMHDDPVSIATVSEPGWAEYTSLNVCAIETFVKENDPTIDIAYPPYGHIAQIAYEIKASSVAVGPSIQVLRRRGR